MSLRSILTYALSYLSTLSKQGLLQVIDILKKEYVGLEEKNHILAIKNVELETEIAKLKSEQIKQKIREVNKTVNQPTSKQPEWETKGVGNDGKGKKNGRGHKGRKGVGNKPKDLIQITRHETSEVETCNKCGKNLSDQPVLASVNTRIIEDIPELPMAPEVIKVVQKKKYCNHCKQVVTASSDLALPNSDIGLNTTVIAIYNWIAMCLPLTRLSDFLAKIFGQILSTSGLSNHIIAVSKIMKSVYNKLCKYSPRQSY